MTDDALSPDLEAASAYLDGVDDTAQRARVDSSPELLALVSSLRGIAATVASPASASADHRDAAVAAALAEFDRLQRVAPHVVPIPSRLRWSRVLTAAAAALIIGAAAIAAINNGHNDASSTSPGEKAAGGATQPPAQSAVAASSTIGAIDSAANALPVLNTPADLRGLQSPLPPTAGTTFGVGTDSVAGDYTGAAKGGGTAGAPGVASAGQNAFAFNCPLGAGKVLVGEILWQGTPAAAVRDTVSGVTQAIDPQCNVLASVNP